MLMVGDYAPHDGASESYEFQLMEEHEENIEKPAEWDRIYEAILERTGNKELAAATATARVGKEDDEPEEQIETEKVEKRLLFVVSTPSDLDIARRRHLCGPSGERFAKSYLEPLGLGRSDVDVVDLGELDEVKDLEPLAVVTLGKTAKELLGDVVDVSLPHPAAIKTDRARDGLGRRLAELGAILEKADSFLPPKGVQEQAEIGLRMRESQPPSKRGGPRSVSLELETSRMGDGSPRIRSDGWRPSSLDTKSTSTHLKTATRIIRTILAEVSRRGSYGEAMRGNDSPRRS